jgi:uncharacterized damage-inducible protein DinB
MQTDEIQKIRERITRARTLLLAAVEKLDPSSWEWQPGDGQWSIRLVLAHVGSSQWSHLEVARRVAAGEQTDIPDFDLDTWNTARVAERADWPVERILDDLETAQRETLAFLDGIDAETLAVTGAHPALGQVTVGQALRIISVHDGMHRRDILKLHGEMRNG